MRKLYPIITIAMGKGVRKTPGCRNYWQRLSDLLRWFLLYDEVLYYYYFFNFQNKSRAEQDEYLSWVEHDILMEKTNRLLVDADDPLDYRVLSFDKYVANNYLEKMNIPCVKNEALITKKLELIWPDSKIDTVKSLFEREDFEDIYIKPINKWGGKGIIRAYPKQGYYRQAGQQFPLSVLESTLKDAIWTVQKTISQHRDLRKFNENCVNTLRIITVLEKHEPQYFASFVRLTIGDRIVDNWEAGSLAIGIDARTGVFFPEAFYKPKGFVMPLCYEHPDSKILFKDFKVPYFFEAIEIAKQAHRFFYGTFIIGWDMAITENGPVIIEANCRPTFHPLQMWYGGMRKYLTEVHKYYSKQ